MQNINLRSIDLNLLPIFEATYEQRSLSKAAERLAMTQPAVSHALSRLRSALRDELFVRHSRGVTPTPVADALYARVGEALGLVRAGLDESRGFDPRTSTRHFVVAIPHPLGPLLALRILQRIEREAPGITLGFSTRSRPVDLESRLWEGRFDLAVDWLRPAREGLAEEVLAEDQLAIVARRGHPATRGHPTVKSLSEQWKFVALRPRQSADELPPEIARDWARLQPRVALQVSELLEVLAVAAESDLLGLAPMTLIRAAARVMSIQPVSLAVPLARFNVRMAWRPGRGPDPAHEFLREQVRAAMKEALQKQRA